MAKKNVQQNKSKVSKTVSNIEEVKEEIVASIAINEPSDEDKTEEILSDILNIEEKETDIRVEEEKPVFKVNKPLVNFGWGWNGVEMEY